MYVEDDGDGGVNGGGDYDDADNDDDVDKPTKLYLTNTPRVNPNHPSAKMCLQRKHAVMTL